MILLIVGLIVGLLFACADKTVPVESPATADMPATVLESVPEESAEPAPEQAAVPAETAPDTDMKPDNAADMTADVAVDENAYTTTVTVTTSTGVYRDTFDQALMYADSFLIDTQVDDGYTELYVTGDSASDDYVTVVYRIENGQLRRTVVYNGFLSCDGNGRVTFSANVNILGTWGGKYTCKLQPDFSFQQDSPYTIIRYDGDWADRKLTTRMEGLPVHAVDGAQEACSLPMGTELFPVETDMSTYINLADEKGTLYRLDIWRPEDDWEWHIGDDTETDWFGELMYAG